jgi:ssDNA-binding Zn-finger/Zn-ribbon topoisomerase 1
VPLKLMSESLQHDVTCPDCGAKMTLRRTQKFKWNNGEGRLFYGCSRWPKCNAVHGAHPDGRPLGTPGDAATKKARIEAHAALASLCERRNWKIGKSSERRGAYLWLAQKLGIAEEKCHIAMFDVETCKRVVEVCSK